jgi:hypothetical protein
LPGFGRACVFETEIFRGAIEDALAAMAAARHLSVDGSLASVLIAYRLEDSLTGVISQNLLRLSPAQLHQLVIGLDGLPRGSNLRNAFESEKLSRNDLLSAVAGAQSRDELIEQLVHNLPVLQSNRKLAAEIVDGCGGTVKGYTECVDQQYSFYVSWASRFTLPAEQFEKAYKVEFNELTRNNPVAQQFTPSLPRFRWAEAHEQTRRALLQTAIAVRLDGPQVLSQHLDPYDERPFRYTSTGEGFCLESRLTDSGLPISLSIPPNFVERQAIPK